MGRLPRRRLVISRVLNRGKVINFLVIRDDNNPGWVLPRCPFDPGCAFGQPVLFRPAELLISIAFISFNVPIGRFISDRPDRPGPENVFLPKQDLHVVVGDWLVVPREIQVDIRDLVTLKP